MSLATRDLTPLLGAEIMGVDLSKPLSAELAQNILDIWHEKSIILIRGQNFRSQYFLRSLSVSEETLR